MDVYRSTRRQLRKGRNAFSLIEVVLALGVISFCVIPLLALMSVGLQSSKSSQQDTALATATKYILSDLRRQSSLTNQTYVFDYEGIPTSPVAISSQPGFYTSTVSVINNPLATVTSWGSNNPNLIGIKIVFTWPGQTNTGSNVKVFHTSLSSY